MVPVLRLQQGGVQSTSPTCNQSSALRASGNRMDAIAETDGEEGAIESTKEEEEKTEEYE